MVETILAMLSPMATLFLCIVIGFALRKLNIIPDNSAKVMAKMENWIFCPALSFYTMSSFFTLQNLSLHSVNIIFGCIAVGVSVAIAIPLSCAFVKKKCYDRNVYRYALAIANIGYMGDPIVLTLFGSEALAYYKIFYLPFSIVIYIWGISILVPKESRSRNPIKNIFNPPTIALFIGILFGLTGIKRYLPAFIIDTIVSLKNCMGPVAMLLAGVTIANYNFLGMITKKKVYVVSLFRLIVLPLLIVSIMFGCKELISIIFNLKVSNNVLYYVLFATATPVGMNTIMFPETFGGDPESGASMVMISHTLCVLTIPIMYALATTVFGGFLV